MPLNIALIAHDAKKADLADWVSRNQEALGKHRLVATATTGHSIRKACAGISLETVKSGPLGGDQQIGGMIADGKIDVLVFLPDPLSPMPHDVDVKALLRIALVYNIPCAFNRRTADQLINSRLLA